VHMPACDCCFHHPCQALAALSRCAVTTSSAVLMQIPHDDPSDAKMADQPAGIYQKVIPLAMVFFLSTFNLTILAALKDAIVVTNSGAEALPFLASFVVLPASVAYFAFYSRLVSSVEKSWVYYLAILPFVAFFAAFACFVYPYSDSLHFHGLYNAVRSCCHLAYAAWATWCSRDRGMCRWVSILRCVAQHPSCTRTQRVCSAGGAFNPDRPTRSYPRC
jgi:TLC ATP/ADP transporter